MDRLRFIRGCQRVGLRLRDIRDLLDVQYAGDRCACEPTADLAARRLAEVDADLAALVRRRDELAERARRLADPGDCPEPVLGTWRKAVIRDDRD